MAAKYKRLGMIFSLAMVGMTSAAGAVQMGCCADPEKARPEDITYDRIGNAGVRIPIHKEQILPGNRLQFEIDKSEISKWDFAFASTASLYSGPKRKNDTVCPFVDIPEKYVTREPLGGDRIRITMLLGPAIAEKVREYGCAITPRPKP